MNWCNLSKLMAEAGFEPVERPGMASFERVTSDGRRQRLSWFRWSNPKVADQQGIPRNYLVAAISTDDTDLGQIPIEDVPRLRIPLVEWPSEQQAARPWGAVADDIRRVVLPILDAAPGHGYAHLTGLPDGKSYLLR